jgi:DNA-binding MarR family transcriptional regulator
MEVLGYVERTQNKQDKRLSDIRFTQKGRAGFEMFRAAQLGFLNLLLEKLHAAERLQVLQAVKSAAELFQKAVIKAAEKE